MSHRVPNSSFCWRQASVDWQMSTGKCLAANYLKESQPVPACLTESKTVASVGDRQVSTGKCLQASFCWQTVSKCPNLSQTVPNTVTVGDRQVSTCKCQQASVCWQTALKIPNLSQHVPNSSFSNFCWQQASVDRQMSTGKCMSANCLKESQPVPACLTEFIVTVDAIGDRQVSTGKCQQASVYWQTASKSPNLSQHLSQSPKQ